MTEFYRIYISVKQGFPRFPKFVTHMIYYINIYNFNSKKKKQWDSFIDWNCVQDSPATQTMKWL